LNSLHVDDHRDEVLASPHPELDDQVLVQVDRADVAEALGVIDESCSVGEAGVIHGVPVTA